MQHTACPPRRTRRHRHQKGAVAIEFALLFMVFFAVFYGLVSYSLVILVKHGLTQAAADGARAAVRLDPLSFTSALNYNNAVRTLVQAQTLQSLQALPQPIQDKLALHREVDITIAPSTRLVVTGGAALSIKITTITVKVTYKDYAQFPLLPAFKWADDAGSALPPLPTDLSGTASFQLQL